ncbi:MAG: hypothetical protein ACKVP7_08080 [Hyphomicrobiaceae bacterium]
MAAIGLSACTKSSAIPLAADTVQITTQAAPLCGVVGAQQVAARRASIETINRGFDRFIIVDGQYQNNVRVVGHTPVIANTTAHATAFGNHAYGQARTTYTGGQPIIGGSHNQGLIVKMFKEGDPAGANAVSARQMLGPDWKKAVTEGSASTC